MRNCEVLAGSGLKRSLIIDTDPGIDDTIALIIAMCADELDIVHITTVAGNVDARKGAENAMAIRDALGKRVPVACGCHQPLMGTHTNGSHVHGESGTGAVIFRPSQSSVTEYHAIEAIRKTLSEANHKVTLLCLASLTNVAVFLKTYPELVCRIEEIVFMGGSFGLGNNNSVAEFNFFADPHAAQIVMDSPVKTVMVGLNVTSRAILTAFTLDRIQQFGDIGSATYHLLRSYNTRAGNVRDGMPVHDVCALFFIMSPEHFSTRAYSAQVQLDGPAKGACVVDQHFRTPGVSNLTVCTDVDSGQYNRWLLKMLERLADTPLEFFLADQ